MKIQNNYLENRCQRVNQALEKYLPAATQEPKKLHAAMRYAVLNGGKRIRPLLVYAAGETFGAELELLDIPACAIELVHCYSLIHDDLPAMDNDAWRRGKPTCHKAFDEATAILAGDTLFNLAIQVLAENLPPAKCKAMLSVLTRASGSLGMAGGQAIDLESIGKQLTLEQLEHMHNLKTGALIRASVKLGGLAAEATSQQLENLDQYAKCMGLVFQIQDDILDVDQYVTILGIGKTKKKLQELQEQALQHLQNLNTNSELLFSLTKFIMQREF